LGKDEVERMWKEGELHAEEDRRSRDEIEMKNRADSLVYSAEKMLKEHRDKVSESDAKDIETAIEEAKKAIQGTDPGKIQAAVDRLTTASHKLAEAMYKQAASSTATPPPSGGTAEAGAGPTDGAAKAKGDGEVIDAEVVDEKKQ